MRKQSILAILICLLCVVIYAEDKLPTGAFQAGEFTLTFNGDGSYTVAAGDRIVVKGTYTVAKDEIAFKDSEGDYACVQDKPGKYKWKYDGKAITFTKVEDECDGRSQALPAQPFVKK
jgi:predicted lipoprotein with Yx(FWY)xxD motif